jgi:hypothetical protein
MAGKSLSIEAFQRASRFFARYRGDLGDWDYFQFSGLAQCALKRFDIFASYPSDMQNHGILPFLRLPYPR